MGVNYLNELFCPEKTCCPSCAGAPLLRLLSPEAPPPKPRTAAADPPSGPELQGAGAAATLRGCSFGQDTHGEFTLFRGRV